MIRISYWTAILLLALPLVQAQAGVALFTPPTEPEPLQIRDGQQHITLSFEKGRWWITGADLRRHIADRVAVEQLFERLATLKAERSVGRYGQVPDDAFAAPVTVVWGDQQIQIGGPSRIPGLRYGHLTDGSLHLLGPLDLPRSIDGLVDRRLFPQGIGMVTEVNISGPRHLLHASRKEGSWRLTAPQASRMEPQVVDDWLAQLLTLQGDPVPEAIREEQMAVQLIRADGPLIEMAFLDDNVVALAGETFQIDTPQPTLPRYFDWMEKQIVDIAPGDITGIQVQHEDTTRVFQRNERRQWIDRISGLRYRTWTTRLFELLAPLTATGLLDEVPENLGPADLEIRLWKGKSVFSTIELWPSEEGVWRCRGGDGLFVFEVDKALATHLQKLF